MNGILRKNLLASTVIGSALAIAFPVSAQDRAANDEEGVIVVTGSRIARPELEAAAPVAVVSSDAIQRQGITNVQDLTQKLPQVGIPGLSKTNSNFLTSGNGVATINLRNLDDERTLVLVNGRRFVSGVAGTSIVDVNNIPTDFVDRIEVNTGGASAIYGSDAIAGVVNFILKDNFEGLRARVQYGISSRGDNRNYTASLSGGTKFGSDDRGAIMGNFTYSKDLGLRSRDRKISQEDCSFLGCGPQSYSSYAAQGRFQLYDKGGPSAGPNLFTFNPDNSLVMGFPVGYGYNRNNDRRISTPVERYLGTVIGHYDFSDAVKFYVEGSYAKTYSSSAIEPYALGSDNDLGFGYAIDNPFIPAAIQDLIAARNSDADPTNDVDQISFRRRQNDVFSRSNRNRRETFRIATGFKGDLGEKWHYDVSYVYGQLKDHTQTEDLDIVKYANALDAINLNGQIVCRDPVARAAGCVPINLFGYNTVSPAAAAYVQAAVPRTDDVKNTQQVLTASVSGSLFKLPYGDLQIAFGGEYRREKSVDNWDPITNAGQNTGNMTPDTVGKYNVKEVFGEVNIPLLADLPFAHSLSVQGAVRYSRYSTVGSVVSWNAGAEYAPIPGLRFRGNYAVANRAPNIAELFQPPSETFPTVSDPCDGITASTSGAIAAACRTVPAISAAVQNGGTFSYSLADIQGINGFDGGNRKLKEETGKTLTLGAVLTPAALRGFSLTVDYFDIRVSNAIDIVDRQVSIEQCLLSGLSEFCNNVIRSSVTGKILTVNALNINIATLKTRGIDFNLAYGRDLGLFRNDHIDFNLLYTHTMRYKRQASPAAPAKSGLGNLQYGEVFRDKATANLVYAVGPFSLSWTTTYLSKMHDTPPAEFDPAGTLQFLIDSGVSEQEARKLVSHNNIKARFYHDVQLRFDVGEKKQFQLFAGVDNLFDRKPPKLEDTLFFGTITGTTTAADVYDPFGRRFYFGAQLKY